MNQNKAIYKGCIVMYEELTSLIPEFKKLKISESDIGDDGYFSERPESIEKLYQCIMRYGLDSMMQTEKSFISNALEKKPISKMDADTVISELYYMYWEIKWVGESGVLEDCKNGNIIKLLERLKELDIPNKSYKTRCLF